MNWSASPDLIAVGLLAWAFAAVSRNCCTFASKNWLTGWLFVILHSAAMFLAPHSGLPQTLASACSVLALILAAVFFMRASAPRAVGRRTPERGGTAPFALLAGALSLFTCALFLQAPQWILNVSAALVGLTPLFVALISPRHLHAILRWSSSALYLALWLFLWKAQYLSDRTNLALDATLFTVYLGCALHFWYHFKKATIGSWLTITSFVLWAVVFALAPLFRAWIPATLLEDEISNLPKYVVAVGVILLMLEEQMERTQHLALHDELTGLPNRRLFQDRLSGAIERARRAGKPTALLMIDLNHFKAVNDCLGHHTGDLLLQQVSILFSTRIRLSDTVARTGGDEFSVILEAPTTRADAEFVARALLELLKPPLLIGEQTVQVGASIGIAIFPDDAQDAQSLSILADMRMYDGKRSRGARSTENAPIAQSFPTPASPSSLA